MAASAVLLFLAVSARAGEIDDAERGLKAADLESRRAAIETLVRINSRRSLDVLVDALRVAHKEDAARQTAYAKDFEKSWEAFTDLKREMEAAVASGVSREDALALMRRFNVMFAKLGAVQNEILPHMALVTGGAIALGKFTSAEAVARIEDLAQREPPGPMRWACLCALVDVSTGAMVPTLLNLARDPDSRVRAVAVRALRRHVKRPGVVEQLEASARDSVWQVRRGAYLALAAAPPERAGPLLEAARARETGDQRRLLERLLQRTGRGPGPPAAAPVAFGLPLTSTRVRFVIELSDTMQDSIVSVRKEIGRALDALPDDALFEIVGLSFRDVRFSSGPEPATAANRGRARQWLAKLKAEGPPEQIRLWALLAPDYGDADSGQRVFEALPDAIYLLLHELGGKGTDEVLERLAVWNEACDATFHARAYGKQRPSELAERLVKKTGGSFTMGP